MGWWIDRLALAQPTNDAETVTRPTDQYSPTHACRRKLLLGLHCQKNNAPSHRRYGTTRTCDHQATKSPASIHLLPVLSL